MQGSRFGTRRPPPRLATDGSSDLIEAGFHHGKVDLADLETGRVRAGNLSKDWPALVVYIWAINLSKGDTITVTLKGPDRADLSNSVTLDRSKAQYLLFTGKRRPPGGWPAGIYEGSVKVTQGGKVRMQREWRAEVR